MKKARNSFTRLFSALLAVLLWNGLVQAADLALAVPEPADYRMENYRAPVPATLQGAKVVSLSEAQALHAEGKTLFLDVMPRLPKPAGLPAGTLWRDAPRNNIPGSIWLANVGYGALSADMDVYFREGLAKLTSQNKSAPLLFYCMSNCWMSWNAARRALSMGYDNVYWFPDGADGWEKAGGNLETAQPFAAKD